MRSWTSSGRGSLPRFTRPETRTPTKLSPLKRSNLDIDQKLKMVIIKDSSLVLTPSHIKAYMLMTLQGLEYLHQHWILHRDLKPNNLLLDENGVLKLADFGLAKSFGSPNRAYTHQVVTRWYRAPELLFGARMYGVGVDMWAVGCILAELLLRVPFLPGDSDLDQLTRIFETLGTPTEEQWPDMCSLPDFVTFKSFPGVPLPHIFSAAGDDLLALIQGLFLFNPCTRITATQALKTKYFSNRPGPTPGCQLPRPNCPVETLKEQANPSLATKRKRTENLEQVLPLKSIPLNSCSVAPIKGIAERRDAPKDDRPHICCPW
ncbi:cyclin-dependent kinase 7 isoform X7 [Pipistrellus kuhlii]|uniref:cyclin-dependent kinase 7 isoform X7 n=1 Tax=Pipistrellus kuhlii TaxID=59472 RepID=UPI00174F0346|nr:cyclin-dependent kinase 7 isoform X7 [Pipistrellus kuhlii]